MIFPLKQTQQPHTAMKRIEAIIKPFKLGEVRAALNEIGIEAMTVMEVRGCGHERSHIESFRSDEYVLDFLPKLKLDLIVEDQQAEAAVEAIIMAARNGTICDGSVSVSSVEQVFYIRKEREKNGTTRPLEQDYSKMPLASNEHA